MRAALALYAVRFGGWLLAKAIGGPVDIDVAFDGYLLSRGYGA